MPAYGHAATVTALLDAALAQREARHKAAFLGDCLVATCAVCHPREVRDNLASPAWVGRLTTSPLRRVVR